MAIALFPLLAIANGLLVADTVIKQGKAQENELERQAEEEKISAEGRELERREQLNKVLAQSVVGQSSSGMKGEGTPESIALANAKTASLSEGMESLSDRLRQAHLKRKAKNTRTSGNLAAASTLLKTGVQVAELS